MELSSKLVANSDAIAGLFSRMENFEERLHQATSSPPTSQLDLRTLAREFSEFKSLVWQSLSKLKVQTDLLTLGLDRHETFMRRKTLLIHGVAETIEENVQEVVVNLFNNKMNMPDLTICDLQSGHRLGAKLGSTSAKPRPILVRFRDFEHRRLVWDSKTTLKNSGAIISEFLTKARHDVFVAARKHFSVKNCWSSEGKIVVLLPDRSRRKIETAGELQSLIALHPEKADKVGPETGSNLSAKTSSRAPAAEQSSQGPARKLRDRNK